MLIYNELPTAFTWYDKKEKQQRFRENAAKGTDYKLISPGTKMLPFQIVVADGSTPTTWEVFKAGCPDVLAATITGYISTIAGIQLETGTYATYNGADLYFTMAGTAEVLDVLPEGCYFSVLTMSGGQKYYSEVYKVVTNTAKYIKLEYWSDCDLSPLAYKNTEFKQEVYLDTFIHASEPEIEQEGDRDGNNQLITTFEKMVVKYRFAAVVPDFLKIALTSMQMHSNVVLTTEDGVRSGNIDRLTVTATVESTGAYSTVDVVLEQLLITKDSCCLEIPTVNASPW